MEGVLELVILPYLSNLFPNFHQEYFPSECHCLQTQNKDSGSYKSRSRSGILHLVSHIHVFPKCIHRYLLGEDQHEFWWSFHKEVSYNVFGPWQLERGKWKAKEESKWLCAYVHKCMFCCGEWRNVCVCVRACVCARVCVCVWGGGGYVGGWGGGAS